MKPTALVTHLMCVFIGAAAAYFYVSTTHAPPRTGNPILQVLQTPPASGLSPPPKSTATDSLQTHPNQAVDIALSQVSETSQPRSALLQTLLESNEWQEEIARQRDTYEPTFMPGVYGQEPLPEFAKTGLERTAREHDEHVTQAADGWSAEMESRLRAFFAFQPEVSTSARVSITCRTSQCMLQLASRRDAQSSGQDPAQLIPRLRQEDWYDQNFSEPSTRDIVPGSSRANIAYELWTLHRRN
jgi:hypothetical protein